MNDWRTRSYLQIAALELLLGGPPAASDPEVRRRRDVWLAIDRFCWPQYKEQQFGQLETFTRTQAELLGYTLQSPPMRDLILPKPVLSGAAGGHGVEGAPGAAAPGAAGPGGAADARPPVPPELPEPTPGFPDWRSRSLFQISELTRQLGGEKKEGEVVRRSNLWLAVERFSWPQMKEQQFGQIEAITRTENDLLRYLFQTPKAKELVLTGAVASEPGLGSAAVAAAAAAPASKPADGKAAAAAARGPGAGQVFGEATEVDLQGERSKGTKKVEKKRSGASAPKGMSSSSLGGGVIGEESVIHVAPDVDPMGDIAPVEKYKGPPAAWCYTEGAKAWGEFAEWEYKDKKKARAAAAMLKDIFGFLDKNPESEVQLKGLEEVVGLSCQEVLMGALERRMR